ncbi:MAG: hypothetical protein KDC80_15360, partial [Saprospiraceae bacterium]|nr:hypothetical protein [Saprospiraceae bacterium]
QGLYATGYKDGDYKKTYDLDVDSPAAHNQPHHRPHGDPYVRPSATQPVNHAPIDDEGQWKEQKQKEELRAKNKKLNNPQAVIDLENEPAYLRRRVELDDVPHSSEVTVSRWTITGDEEPEIRRDNPYLHDNVD